MLSYVLGPPLHEMSVNGEVKAGIRSPTKGDFDKLREVVDKSDGWIRQYNKKDVQVYTKSQEGTAIKMIKVKTFLIIYSTCYKEIRQNFFKIKCLCTCRLSSRLLFVLS